MPWFQQLPTGLFKFITPLEIRSPLPRSKVPEKGNVFPKSEQEDAFQGGGPSPLRPPMDHAVSKECVQANGFLAVGSLMGSRACDQGLPRAWAGAQPAGHPGRRQPNGFPFLSPLSSVNSRHQKAFNGDKIASSSPPHTRPHLFQMRL